MPASEQLDSNLLPIFINIAATPMWQGQVHQTLEDAVASAQLAGKRVLVVEDEIFIAMDLADSLAEAGAEVVGPCATLDDAREAARSGRFDLAVLDVDLGGKEVFPAARLLQGRGIPFVFHTGRPDRATLAADFGDTPICVKPASMDRLIETLQHLLPVAA